MEFQDFLSLLFRFFFLLSSFQLVIPDLLDEGVEISAKRNPETTSRTIRIYTIAKHDSCNTTDGITADGRTSVAGVHEGGVG